MRDAIQGMLSMSRIGMMSTLVTGSSPAERARLATPKRQTKRSEGPDKMPTCFKDDEFGENLLHLYNIVPCQFKQHKTL
jgi:hypothetical protein